MKARSLLESLGSPLPPSPAPVVAPAKGGRNSLWDGLGLWEDIAPAPQTPPARAAGPRTVPSADPTPAPSQQPQTQSQPPQQQGQPQMSQQSMALDDPFISATQLFHAGHLQLLGIDATSVFDMAGNQLPFQPDPAQEEARDAREAAQADAEAGDDFPLSDEAGPAPADTEAGPEGDTSSGEFEKLAAFFPDETDDDTAPEGEPEKEPGEGGEEPEPEPKPKPDAESAPEKKEESAGRSHPLVESMARVRQVIPPSIARPVIERQADWSQCRVLGLGESAAEASEPDQPEPMTLNGLPVAEFMVTGSLPTPSALSIPALVESQDGPASPPEPEAATGLSVVATLKAARRKKK